jgi:Xaa-Pro dipeptidase
MVLGIEPLCYRTGTATACSKDMMRVTDTGCELLSDYLDTDRLLEVK